jgi:hypothetical protein
MDKERLEELKLRVSDAEAHADMVLVAPSTVGELIAEVEFLTKVAEQAMGGLLAHSAQIVERSNGEEWVVFNGAGNHYPELAQYLKRGKE